MADDVAFWKTSTWLTKKRNPSLGTLESSATRREREWRIFPCHLVKGKPCLLTWNVTYLFWISKFPILTLGGLYKGLWGWKFHHFFLHKKFNQLPLERERGRTLERERELWGSQFWTKILFSFSLSIRLILSSSFLRHKTNSWDFLFVILGTHIPIL